jgi:hypothetical protein
MDIHYCKYAQRWKAIQGMQELQRPKIEGSTAFSGLKRTQLIIACSAI